MDSLTPARIPVSLQRLRKAFMSNPASPPPQTHFSRAELLSVIASCGVVGEDADQVVGRAAPRAVRTASGADRWSEYEVLLELIGRCADDRHPFSYLSVPITTGRAYLKYHAGAGPGAEGSADYGRKLARTDNERRAIATAQRLRGTLLGTVIDPSRVAISDWEQDDYHIFWAEVIKRYTETMYFLDGWQYSDGCAIEFATAVQLGLPAFTEHMKPLVLADGQELLHSAIDEYVSVGLDPVRLRQATERAESVVAKGHFSREA
jgi:hypothetical protein